jgi:uncharacterized membrane protein YoaK (UPF0700 family)
MVKGLVAVLRGRWLLLFVLSVTAGAVDVIGFLALDGLVAAHITGNLVLTVHYSTGGFCEVGPPLSVPVFIVVLAWCFRRAGQVGHGSRRALRALHAALLAGYATRGRTEPFILLRF